MSRPPALARWLLGQLVAERDRALLLGDLDEEHSERARRSGALAARAWYWRQAINSFVPLARYRLTAPSVGAQESRSDPMWQNPPQMRLSMKESFGQFWFDLRVGARSLLRDRAFTAAAVLTFALGVALTATTFSVVNGVLLRPLPYANPDGLIIVNNRPANGGFTAVSPAEFFDYQRQAQMIKAAALVQGFNANITGGDHPDRVDAVAVSSNFFTILGVAPLLGKTFGPGDDGAGFTGSAVISYGMWQRVFGSAPSVIGRKIRLDDDDYVIAGVMPAAFKHPINRPGAPVEIWLAAGYHGAPWPTEPVRGARVGDVIARLKPGASLLDVQRDFDRMNGDFLATYPDIYGATGSQWRIAVRPLRDVMIGETGRPLLLLLGAVGFVLLIACTNVASLLFVRGAARRTEVAVRAALGAGRARLVRSMLTEHLLLATFGGLAATALTVVGIGAVRTLVPVGLPRGDEITIDWRVLLFIFGCTLAAGLVVGVLPATIGARTSLAEVLRAGGRAATQSVASRRARSTLVVFELAMSVLLLIGAGLVVRSFMAIEAVNLGFTPEHVLTAEITVSLPNDRSLGKYVAAAPRALFFERVLNGLRALPGVDHVAGTNAVPLRDNSFESGVAIDGSAPVPLPQLPQVTIHSVSADYFTTMETPIVRGAGLNDSDQIGMPVNIVLSETAARKLFANADPIGKRLKRGPADGPMPWMTVVGVARDALLRSADGEAASDIYLPMQQVPPVTLAMLIRTQQDPAALAPQIARVVHSIDPDQPVYRVAAMPTVVGAAVGQRRFAVWLFVAFAVMSLGLAAVGVYGLAAQSVAYRRREIGLRMALGADAGMVLGLILRDALCLALAGVALGLILAFPMTRLLQSQLFGISAHDPLVFGAIAPVLLGVTALASYLPGRTAARMNPVTALRSD